MRRGGAAIIVALFAFASSDAFADAGAGEDVDTLLKQLQQETSALSTQDCAIACKAYASIRRAADKICGLEPGPRCADARAKADDAQRRVQAACPDCHLAAGKPKDDERRAVEYAPPTASPGAMGKGGDTSEEKNAPSRGGCRSCNTPGDRPTGDFGIVILGAWAISRLLRKKSSRRV